MVELRDVVAILIFAGLFMAATSGAALVSALWQFDRRRGVARLRELGTPQDRPASGPFKTLPVAGRLLPVGNEALQRVRERLAAAGLHGPQAAEAFQSFRLALGLLLPAPAGVGLWAAGFSPLLIGLGAFSAAAVGMLAPGLWLDARTRWRQAALRRGLPDALDMTVLCLEGGVSLAAALQRVTAELQNAHPELAAELTVVERETQLGASAGEAVKKFGDRSGLAEVRELASVLLQSERFGAGVVKALRIHADTCREERRQRAEELAQKAAVKILFPTLLCIFPAIFIVVLGPAAYQIAAMFSKMR